VWFVGRLLILGNIGSIYNTQGKHSEAEALFSRALTIQEQTYGKEHLCLLENIEELRNVSRKLGNSDKVDFLKNRLLLIKSKEEMVDSASLLSIIKYLALGYYKQKKYSEAEEYFCRALKIHEELDTQDENIASMLTLLSNIYYSTKRLQQAESACERAYDIYLNINGQDHERTQNTEQVLVKLRKLISLNSVTKN